MSRILRHAPGEAGLSLEPGGWARFDDLQAGLKAAGHCLNREDVLRIMAENDKRRFTLADDGQRTRAAQGHSVAVDLQLAPAVPPPTLFHGTAWTSLEPIVAEGLKPGRRQHVHMSPDAATAQKVGARHGCPVVLRVDTARMHAEGHPFWQADNDVWLTDQVSPRYLVVEALDAA